MAKKIKKVTLDKDCLAEVLELRKTSIRKMGANFDFGWSAKSIGRGVSSGEVAPELLDDLGKYLDVDPDYLSGKYHRDAEKIDNPIICANIKSSLRASRFPYLCKQQRTKINGKFLYDKYFESLLVLHGISMKQCNALPRDEQGKLQMEIENAIAKILISYFHQNAAGEDTYPNLYQLLNSMEDFYSSEPEIPIEALDFEITREE